MPCRSPRHGIPAEEARGAPVSLVSRISSGSRSEPSGYPTHLKTNVGHAGSSR